MAQSDSVKLLERLSPAETAVFINKVENYKSKIKSGIEIGPITITKVDDLFVVRNGNNRVRAFCECMQEGVVLPQITTIVNSDYCHEEYIQMVKKLNQVYGKGVSAFEKLPLVKSDEDYQEISYQFNQK